MNKEELTCRTSEHGPEVTACPRPEYDDFTRSLRERAVAGEKLSAAIPSPLQGVAAAGRLPEEVAPVRADEGFILDPSQSTGIASIRLRMIQRYSVRPALATWRIC